MPRNLTAISSSDEWTKWTLEQWLTEDEERSKGCFWMHIKLSLRISTPQVSLYRYSNDFYAFNWLQQLLRNVKSGKTAYIAVLSSSKCDFQQQAGRLDRGEGLTNHGSMKDPRRRWHGWKFKLLFQEEISVTHDFIYIPIPSKRTFTNAESYKSPEKIWTASDYIHASQ